MAAIFSALKEKAEAMGRRGWRSAAGVDVGE